MSSGAGSFLLALDPCSLPDARKSQDLDIITGLQRAVYLQIGSRKLKSSMPKFRATANLSTAAAEN